MDTGLPGDAPIAASACFRECCKSNTVPLAAPKSAFVTHLTQIHDGPASAVFLGRFNSMPVAVKRPKLPTKADIDRYHVELRLMLELRHENILPLLAAHARPPEYFLLFPYQENGSVSALVHELGWRPSWGAVLLVLRQVACALEYVHGSGYVHRDVKPSNILLDKDWRAVLCDFGLAESETELRASLQNAVYSEEDAEGKTVAGRLIGAMGGSGGSAPKDATPNVFKKQGTANGGKPSGGFQKQHMVGTLPYMPPEVLMRQVPGYSADVYAFGITACEIATGIQPYSDRERNVALAHTVLDLSYNESDLAVAIASEHLRPSLPSETIGTRGARDAANEASERTNTNAGSRVSHGTDDPGFGTTRSPGATAAADGISKLASECWSKDIARRPPFARIVAAIDEVTAEVNRSAGVVPGTPHAPLWFPPTRVRRDAGEAASAAHQRLFAKRAWPRWPDAPRGAPPQSWPSLGSASAGPARCRAGVFSTSGARGGDKMEDRHLLVHDVGGCEGAHLLCVFDGHRGFECAEFCRLHFLDIFLSVWGACETPEEALERTFELADGAFVEAFEATKSAFARDATNGSRERFPGCTACACLVWGDFAFAANAGDCRAVLCREPGSCAVGDASKTVLRLTTDHSASANRDERARIERDFGPNALRVVNGTTIRVGPAGLAVTRAIGDLDCAPYGVLSKPEVTVTKLDRLRDRALVLACDGLWDVVSDEDAGNMLRDTVKEPSMCAKRLGGEALARNSGDNVTVVVAFLAETDSAETVTWERAF
jgi:serine/threonine protein phosphatase PrpC/serine/threonine protein kinase